MAFLSSFYPQPVVAGTTEGTFAEGNDARITGAIQSGGAAGGGLSGAYPNPTLAALKTKNKLWNFSHPYGFGGQEYDGPTARNFDTRLGEWINVKDWGAVGDGLTDDTLAIQRAICASFMTVDPTNLSLDKSIPDNWQQYWGGVQPSFASGTYTRSGTLLTITTGVAHNLKQGDICWYDFTSGSASDGAFQVVSVINANTFTANHTVSGTASGNVSLYPALPKLFWGTGRRKVFFPQGYYRITSPIIVCQGVWLEGMQSQQGTIIRSDSNYREEYIMDYGRWMDINWFANRPSSEVWTASVYHYNHGLQIKNLWLQGNSGSDQTVEDYRFTRIPNGIAGVANLTIANGNSGSTSISLSNRGFTLPMGYDPKWKIKFGNHDTVYEVVSNDNVSGTQITIQPALTSSVPAGTTVLLGIPSHIGICVSGGEDSSIENVSVHNFAVGVFQGDSSPASYIVNTSAWNCDVGYWSEVSPTQIIKTSGDGCNVYFRMGIGLSSPITATIIGGKHEVAGNHFRAFIEHVCAEQTNASNLNYFGGTWNGINKVISDQNSATWLNTAVVDLWSQAFDFAGNVTINGLNTFNNCQYQVRLRNNYDGSIKQLWPTADGGTSGLQSFRHGGISRIGAGLMEKYPAYGGNFRLTPWIFDGSATGNPIYYGAGLLLDGQAGIWGTATFTRSGTTVTITASTPHKLCKGDWVQLVYSGLTYPATDSGGLENSTYNGIAKVQTIVNSTQFTLLCNNGGPESGTANLYCMRMTDMHIIQNNEHRFQMPCNIGQNSTTRLAFGFFDKFKRLISGIRVAAEGVADLWATGNLRLGGSIDSPTTIVSYGTGAPSASAPNGSLYLRTDGDASSTLYVRAGGTWKPLSSYEA